jgi:hypothetical protein
MTAERRMRVPVGCSLLAAAVVLLIGLTFFISPLVPLTPEQEEWCSRNRNAVERHFRGAERRPADQEWKEACRVAFESRNLEP